MKCSPQLETQWHTVLKAEFEKPYMQELKAFLLREKEQGKVIFPAGKDMFSAFNLTPFDQVKAVILGQDPYHGAGQAHGLSFSVLPGVRVPPSLKNIYKELMHELGMKMPAHGCLTSWAAQGVLLLNTVLSVRQSEAFSHRERGWEQLTDAAISALSQQRQGIVFFLWGSAAQKKQALIDRKRHLILTAPHPSPLSAHRGFLGCGHFLKANAYLQEQKLKPIIWSSVLEEPQTVIQKATV